MKKLKQIKSLFNITLATVGILVLGNVSYAQPQIQISMEDAGLKFNIEKAVVLAPAESVSMLADSAKDDLVVWTALKKAERTLSTKITTENLSSANTPHKEFVAVSFFQNDKILNSKPVEINLKENYTTIELDNYRIDIEVNKSGDGTNVLYKVNMLAKAKKP